MAIGPEMDQAAGPADEIIPYSIILASGNKPVMPCYIRVYSPLHILGRHSQGYTPKPTADDHRNQVDPIGHHPLKQADRPSAYSPA